MARKSETKTPARDEQAEKKAWLDDLIARTPGISKRTAQKLREANGTSSDAPAQAEERTTGGHGSSAPQMPDFGSL